MVADMPTASKSNLTLARNVVKRENMPWSWPAYVKRRKVTVTVQGIVHQLHSSKLPLALPVTHFYPFLHVFEISKGS